MESGFPTRKFARQVLAARLAFPSDRLDLISSSVGGHRARTNAGIHAKVSEQVSADRTSFRGAGKTVPRKRAAGREDPQASEAGNGNCISAQARGTFGRAECTP